MLSDIDGGKTVMFNTELFLYVGWVLTVSVCVTSPWDIEQKSQKQYVAVNRRCAGWFGVLPAKFLRFQVKPVGLGLYGLGIKIGFRSRNFKWFYHFGAGMEYYGNRLMVRVRLNDTIKNRKHPERRIFGAVGIFRTSMV